MSYYVMENDELILVETKDLPEELEKLYREIRRMYIIEFSCSDWAEDTGDAGMGYDYDNSYELFREPQRKEMVVRDGRLVGFYVGYQLESNATKKYLLSLEQGAKIRHGGPASPRYGNSKKWVLNIKDEPAPLDYVCLMWVDEDEREHTFTPEEFECKYVRSVLKEYRWQDSYGRFDGAFRVVLELTKEGAQNPDEVLKALEKYKPVLIKA